jgi:hypothetical protein
MASVAGGRKRARGPEQSVVDVVRQPHLYLRDDKGVVFVTLLDEGDWIHCGTIDEYEDEYCAVLSEGRAPGRRWEISVAPKASADLTSDMKVFAHHRGAPIYLIVGGGYNEPTWVEAMDTTSESARLKGSLAKAYCRFAQRHEFKNRWIQKRDQDSTLATSAQGNWTSQGFTQPAHIFFLCRCTEGRGGHDTVPPRRVLFATHTQWHPHTRSSYT